MAEPLPKNNQSKIIPVGTGGNPDGPHGICWRSIGSQVILAQVGTQSQFTPGPIQAQPVKISTEVPCIGERCHAWNRDLQHCHFVLDRWTLQTYRDTLRQEEKLNKERKPPK